ncbi:hypothetical protein [Streptomyces flavotricini]|uniref:hypothetical protein n=1 Tax=Streptomyces flavotricini TaxID=66888 RepID=UPI001E336866|nr:hypothetical protein [Streptomyces flavotricini]
MKRLIALAVPILLALTSQAVAAPARSGSGIDFRTALQPIDGFGFSMAFQRADLLHGARGLSPAKQREVLDLLLSKDKGAGLSILRPGIGASTDRVYDHMPTILPADPGGPDATPKYVWDGWAGGQVRLATEAKAYGVKRFFADAWRPETSLTWTTAKCHDWSARSTNASACAAAFTPIPSLTP